MNQAKKHCYLYTRVSTQMQVDGYSLDAQQDRLKREAAHRSMQVVATFFGRGQIRQEYYRQAAISGNDAPDTERQ